MANQFYQARAVLAHAFAGASSRPLAVRRAGLRKAT